MSGAFGTAPGTAPAARRGDALPGFGLALSLTMLWVSLLVLLPLAALALRPWEHGWRPVLAILADPRVQAALRLSFGAAALAALVNVPLGLLIAWALARTRLPARRLVDALVDLPFALPTAVAGIALATLYGPRGWLGAPLARLDMKVAFTPAGILTALVFVGLPFVVRTVEPVLRDLPPEVEEAAATLGAAPSQTVWRVILPGILPALVTGFGLALARGIGEYGSVIFIAGNMPMRSEIAPLLIVVKLQQFDYAGGACIGLAMLLGAMVCLALVGWLRRAVSFAGRHR